MWDNNEHMAGWLAQQLDAPNSVLQENLRSVKRDAVVRDVMASLDVSTIKY
jgi:hypothetical protein